MQNCGSETGRPGKSLVEGAVHASALHTNQYLNLQLPCCLPPQGNGPLHIAAGALYSVCHGFPAAAPAATASFTALLHRLLTAGADVGEENTAGYTPLGKLLCCGSLVSLSQAVLDGVRALLAVGSTLAAAGGGRAWKAVLSAALTATGETEPWYAGEWVRVV